MWAEETPATATEQAWYKKSEAYWKTQSPSLPGMLGGLDKLHKRDIAASKRFLRGVKPEYGRVLDVGAGIGRVTKALLAPLFEKVDMLEQSEEYMKESEEYLKDVGNVGERYVCGMQEFRSEGFVTRRGVEWSERTNMYDVIWVQWCVIYLTDDDFVEFFVELFKCLKDGGVICVKDNVAKKGFLVDKEDSSVMRCDAYMKYLFAKAGLHPFKAARQNDFPSHIYPVRTYALRALTSDDDEKR